MNRGGKMGSSTALNLKALDQAAVVEQPFPYFLIEDFINPALMDGILADFPDIEQGGSFPVTSKNTTGDLAILLEALESEELKSLIGQKLGMDLQSRSVMMTLRGYSRAKDGKIHTDSKSKLVTLLIYLNPTWEAATGRLRLLYDGENLSPYVAEISPIFGSALVFKVTDNCWHGYEAFEGERRSIQLNYMVSEGWTSRHLWRHRVSAWVKRVLPKISLARPA